MIGDTLEVDILGGMNAGIDQVQRQSPEQKPGSGQQSTAAHLHCFLIKRIGNDLLILYQEAITVTPP